MFPKIAQLKTAAALRARLTELGLQLPVDDNILPAAAGSPMAQPIVLGGRTVGNRWCIHPMEGWDAERDGSPSPLTLRRWRHFGLSGAKLIWGGEAAAVEPAGRANPRQTLATPNNRAGLAALLSAATDTHRERYGSTDDLLVGLQLTHSGRFCRPNSSQLEPQIAFHHPLLDARFGINADDNSVVLTDEAIEALVDSFARAAGVARDAGFSFVDIKACHGYLLHEFLGAHLRPGPFGGDFAGRTRLLREIVRRVRAAWPDLLVVVRLSAFDTVPYEALAGAPGQPVRFSAALPYEYGFGLDRTDPLQIDLSESIQLVRELAALGVSAINVSGGSPYYNPHVQRPAAFPPSDGYLPPEDPLVGVARQIHVARQIKEAVPEMPIVGTGYSYLQEYLPHVAQGVIRAGWADLIGLGRMVLSYPELPADVLNTGQMARKRICRTFSDCTTAPRQGLVSGCFPLDAYYKAMPEAARLAEIKAEKKAK